MDRLFRFASALPLVLIVSAHAELADEVRVYVKCHSQLAKSRPAANDPNYLLVQSGQLRGAAACDALLQGSALTDSGRVPANARAARVLQTFNAEHSTWFQGTPDFNECAYSSPYKEIYEWNEPALFLTRALFQPNTAYRSIVTDRVSLEGLRETARSDVTLNAMQEPLYFASVEGVSTRIWTPTTIEYKKRGQLVGVRTRAINGPEFGPTQLIANRSLFESYGGGLLTSRSFLLRNLEARSNYFHEAAHGETRGGVFTPRRISQAIVRDLLCRNLPLLKSSDVMNLVNNQSALPFRRGASCMQCHATMDTMGRVFRGVVVDKSSFSCAERRDVYVVSFSKQLFPATPEDDFTKRNWPEDEPVMPWPGAGIYQPDGALFSKWLPFKRNVTIRYPLRPAAGHFFMRDFEGRLMDRELSAAGHPSGGGFLGPGETVPGIERLGEALADSADLYACAARRYVKFLMNVDVDLNLPPDSDPARRAYRDFVVQLGRDLQQHQSLSKLMSAIFHSAAYARPADGNPLDREEAP